MTRTIVVLGAGLAATPVIRQLMRNAVLPSKDLKMIVVSPNTHFHWTIAMPRAVVPGQLADDKIMYPLEPTFAEYPSEKFEFVLAAASSLDPSSSAVTVTLNSDKSERKIPFHTLVIATGASAKGDMPWKVVNDTIQTKNRLRQIQDDIARAETIVVAGGGTTGVETAGELGFEYSKSGKKKVYFIHNDKLPLAPTTLASVRKQAVTELEKLNVTILSDTTVVKTTESGKDTTLELRKSDGSKTTITAQAYLPTMGVVPNSSFAPASMLDSHGFIKQTNTLLVEGYSNIFVMGDVGSLEPCKLYNAETQGEHLIKGLPVYLQGGKVAEYKVNTKEIAGITVGRSRATGQMGNFKIFSFLIWYMKGRFMGTDYASPFAAGKKTMLTTFEK